MGLTREEQEVSIGWTADRKLAIIHDYRDGTFKTLTEAGYTNYREHRLDGEIVGWTFYDIPVNVLRLHANGKVTVKTSGRRGPASEGGRTFFSDMKRNNAMQRTLAP